MTRRVIGAHPSLKYLADKAEEALCDAKGNAFSFPDCPRLTCGVRRT
jgi:hypothetical protein